ncbi:MAG: hypothetical protein AYK23_01910 [Candidatus Proteinoplasmatales archaeon SG8-5]|nr:MAG: hypothetical protein AYK23_01910 [Candidatus Proteinoplasmatales archaeon SG8-5]
MGEGKNQRKKAWKIILRPDKLKIMSFIIYTLYILFAYIACYLTEMFRWSERDKDEYEPDVHLWKPWKES